MGGVFGDKGERLFSFFQSFFDERREDPGLHVRPDCTEHCAAAADHLQPVRESGLVLPFHEEEVFVCLLGGEAVDD